MATKKAVKVKPGPAIVKSAEPQEGAAVLYVLDSGAIRPARLIGTTIKVETEPGDGLPNPMSLSLVQYIGGVTAPRFSADQEPGTWHWPPKGE